eukprot:3977078-Lingulodinium_polyedra.AAC.1
MTDEGNANHAEDLINRARRAAGNTVAAPVTTVAQHGSTEASGQVMEQPSSVLHSRSTPHH